MDKKQYIEYWKNSAIHDFEIADTLFKNKKFDACLFFCHLSIEKLLKGCWVKTNSQSIPPRTHNLIRIANELDFSFDEEQKVFLALLTEFNIESRYPDYKLSFYKLCTEEFTKEKYHKTKELFECILENL